MWDLQVPDNTAPTDLDKQSYLQSLLGDKPYLKEYVLLGGSLTITFRTLTTREIDACFKQAYAARTAGKVDSMADFYELVQRFKLYLQLVRVKSTEFDHELPDGLSVETNPNAETFWEFPEGEPVEPLLEVEKYIFKNVLKTDTLSRLTNVRCAHFNRLVSKLEVLTDNPDFWKGIGSQS
jgi:hypothetical protein